MSRSNLYKIEKVIEKMLNKIGPTIEPCGTPGVISAKVLLMLCTLTRCCLLFKCE